MRFAIYFTPAATHPLTRAAAAWLGRDAFADAAVARPAVGGFSPVELAAVTAEPARYGFHGTLVAPFGLRSGQGADDLRRAAAAFAGARSAFAIKRLSLERIGQFFALVPADPLPALDGLASDAVDHSAPFRAPLSEADMARRQPEKLTERQRTYLQRHGYPYVKDEFRFHMTLTGPVMDAEAPRVAAALDNIFAPHLAAGVHVDAVAIFIEPERGAPFHVGSLHPFQKVRLT